MVFGSTVLCLGWSSKEISVSKKYLKIIDDYTRNREILNNMPQPTILLDSNFGVLSQNYAAEPFPTKGTLFKDFLTKLKEVKVPKEVANFFGDEEDSQVSVEGQRKREYS